MDFDVQIIDYERVYSAIKNLVDIDKDKAINVGLKDAGNLFVRSGKSNLKSRSNVVTENLSKSFRVKIKQNKVGMIAGFGAGGNHAHLVDEGTTERYTAKGSFRGKVIGNSFWVDAIHQNETAAIDKVYSGIERAVQNIINK